ncbi:HD-GYP domain-containing protein [Porticoccaceae bacterium LTM1]|nr:HD-GYP domain-containing protein [Porticoccaceae bacterium LTM1]
MEQAYRSFNTDGLSLRQSPQAHSVFFHTIESLGRVMEIRDLYVHSHQNSVSSLAYQIGKVMGLDGDSLQGLKFGAALHDIGKIGVPSSILNKPAKLSPEEFALVKKHCEMGYQILQGIEFPWPVADMVYQHHERLDGSGYPRGLSGNEILLEAQIISVADIVHSISEERPYRLAKGLCKAREVITEGSGKFFHPEVVRACLSIIQPRDAISIY